ncbi:MAG: dephospho-CoA kinase, partial [Ruminococcaceae bacterium]|nr:dephospho-CoA kinase [Oscillospiraceae bacterium]
GGTGSGKSTAATYFKNKGAEIIDADAIAREIVRPGMPALSDIAEAFDDVLLPDGTLDRKKLGTIVFNDDQALLRLNSITHTYIIKEIENRLQTSTAPLTVIDAPLLLECGLEKLCDTTIALLSEPSLRIRRIVARDGLTEAEASARIHAQPADDFYRKSCQYIIENNEDSALLEQQLETVLKELTL